ncbi:MAG TPA: type IV secretory system conjugative DNA transfer family protein [Candidatus Angelobacter sp.]
MTFPNFTDRRFCNKTIITIVLLHFISLMVAARFYDQIWLNQIALYGTLSLYLVLMPILWLWHRATRPQRAQDGLSDIRKAMEDIEQLPSYDPRQFFNLKKGLFVGLNIDRQYEPVYAPWKRVRKAHIQVVGTTGSGKGVATTMMLWQCVLAGECVVIFDPKFPGDEFAPAVLHGLAKQHNIPFYLINLCPEVPAELEKQFPQNPPQFNLFDGCTPSQTEELLTTGFALEDTGSNADHYRLHDRLACIDVCQRATANGRVPTFHDLIQAAGKSQKIDKEKGQDFKAKLEELGRLAVTNTDQGLDLQKILGQNAILYIIGSIRHSQVKRLQKMLLLRIMQIIERRDRRKPLRKVAMMLDELAYLLSPGALQALGTVRDKGCHIFLAHQTLGDLRQGEGLDKEAVTAAVKGNTSLKLIYKVTDPEDTGKWASNLSGTIVVQQQSSHMQQGMFHAAEGQFRQIERPLLTINELLSLPDLTGMFFGYGLSRRIQVGVMPKGEYPTLAAAPPLVIPKQSTEESPVEEKPTNDTTANETPTEVNTKSNSAEPQPTANDTTASQTTPDISNVV